MPALTQLTVGLPAATHSGIFDNRPEAWPTVTARLTRGQRFHHDVQTAFLTGLVAADAHPEHTLSLRTGRRRQTSNPDANAIDQKVDAIAVTLAKPDAMKATVQKAVAAGIPVVVLNSGVGLAKSFGALMSVGQDESLAGESAGQRLAQSGAKDVVCVAPEQGNVSVEARCDGATKTMTSGKVQKLYVNGGDPSAMTSAIQAKIGQDKNIDYFLSQGGAAVLATVDAVKQGGSKAKVTGFDLNPDVAKDIKSGAVAWTIDQQPYLQGYYSIDNLWLYLTNGNIGGGGQTILTGPAFVDSTNIDKVLKFAANGTR